VSRIDDLIQPGPQKVVLAAIARFLWSHLCPQKCLEDRESQLNAPNQIARKHREATDFWQKHQTGKPRKYRLIKWL
jgi:hypothetical protein